MLWFYTLFLGCESCTRNTQADNLDVDQDGFIAKDDCDDNNPNVYPAAPELCDSLDNNCNDEIDEGEPVGSVAFYQDSDGDGYGNPESSLVSCTQPDGYIIDDNDCNDGDDLAYPGANEYCDGVDNDCDGVTDEDSALDSTIFYRDFDGDGFGNPFIFQRGCNAAEGYVENDTDCNDSSVSIHPEAVEICDGLDNDCDDLTDDDDTSVADQLSWYLDIDGDGYGSGAATLACEAPLPTTPIGLFVNEGTDCDEALVLINPSAVEFCGDGFDNDCDGLIDDADDSATDVLWYSDIDEDGYGDPLAPLSVSCVAPSSPAAANDLDCDDTNPDVNPLATEEWYDGIDQDCLGDNDFDADGDGYLAASGGGNDCDDDLDTVHPDQPDLCADGVDDNCDGIGDLCDLNTQLIWETEYTRFGSAFAFADGSIAVGASSYDVHVQGGGAVFVYSSVEDDPLATFYMEEQGSKLGTEIGFGGDIDGNGDADWVFGAYALDANGLDSGAVYWAPVSTAGNLLLDASFIHVAGQSTGDYFGWNVLAGRDLNSDSAVDLAVTAPMADINGGASGAVYLFHGPIEESKNASAADVTLIGAEAGEQSGYAMDMTDLDGDGLQDYVVGAPLNSSNGYAGAVHIMLGDIENIGFLSLSDGHWEGDWPNGRLGTSIQAKDDLNQDGYPDVVVSAPERDNAAGAVYILSGPATEQGSVSDAWAVFYGEHEDSRLGQELLLHDLDGDGFLDLLFSAPDSDSSADQGGVVYFAKGDFGAGTLRADAQYHIEEPSAEFGASILGTSDGVWVGAPGVATESGEIYLLNWF